MSQENVPYYIVAYYVILSVTFVGGHSLISLNPFLPNLTPVRLSPSPPSIWNYYCYWYSACAQCCKYLSIPTSATGSNLLENLPLRTLTAPLHRNMKVPITSSLNNDDPILKTKSSPVLSRRIDNYKRLSLITFLANRVLLPANNLPHTTLDKSKRKNNINNFDIGSSSKTASYIFNTRKSGTRPGISEEGGSKDPEKKERVFTQNVTPLNVNRRYNQNTTKLFMDMSPQTTQRPHHPPQLRQDANDYMRNTSNLSTPASLLVNVHSESIHDSNTYNYEANGTATSTNVSPYGKSVTDESLQSKKESKRDILFGKFRTTLDQIDRKFLLSVFTKLTAISPEDRKENGISFLQSGFFLHQLLMSLPTEMDRNASQEIEECLGLHIPETETIEILERTVSWLPKSSDVLKFRWSSRLVLRQQQSVGSAFRRIARASQLQLSWLNGTETSAQLTESLNKQVEADSGGAMHDTFDEEEVSEVACAVAMGTVYVRAAWRTAPTLLNDTLPFRDAPAAAVPARTSRFFRLNDVMGYAYLHEWDAEAIEISYATPGLTLLMLVPKQPLVRALVERAARVGLGGVLGVMHPVRLAVTLPLYTLRMTLLLPNKLQDMGMPSLLANGTDCQSLKFSHAVQRLMFWAEAGRNAFKDDGIEWDPRPELEIVVDRPYLFFVRWQNITIMNGVFVL